MGLEVQKYLNQEWHSMHCDRCNEDFTDSEGDDMFPDELSVKNEASMEGWKIYKNGTHHCPECRID